MLKQIDSIISPPPFHIVGNGFYVNGFFSEFIIENSPFLLLDYADSKYFAPSMIERGVGSHPHRGFETVTIALKGEITHSDSHLNTDTIKAGDVQWMTAGSGILHQEYFSKNFNKTGGDFEMVQLWVNLPSKYKMITPRYQSIKKENITKLVESGVKLQIVSGKFEDLVGPATTFSPINLYILDLDKNAEFDMSLPKTFTTLILNLMGNVIINSTKLPKSHLLKFNTVGGEEINIQTRENSKLLILSGEPLNEPIAHYGPFVMNTKQELIQAIDDFNSGKFGKL
jgi:quercetin 2,3-dioxygenase